MPVAARTDSIKTNVLDVAKVARHVCWPQSRLSTGFSDADPAISVPSNRDESSANAARSRSLASHKVRQSTPSRPRSQRLKQRRAAGNRPSTILRRRDLRPGSGQQRSRDEATACQLVPRVPGVPRFNDRLEQFARRQVSEVTRSQGWRQVGRGGRRWEWRSHSLSVGPLLISDTSRRRCSGRGLH
jgi:hypothetical protein